MDANVTVFFEPQTEGVKTGILRVVSNDTVGNSTFDIPLYGNALGLASALTSMVISPQRPSVVHRSHVHLQTMVPSHPAVPKTAISHSRTAGPVP